MGSEWFAIDKPDWERLTAEDPLVCEEDRLAWVSIHYEGASIARNSVRHQMALKFAAQVEQCKREEVMRDGE